MCKIEHTVERKLIINVYDEKNILVLQSLASTSRIKILKLLGSKGLMKVSDIAQNLKMPMSTAILHINKLEQARLIHTEQTPSTGGGGLQKLCRKNYNRIYVEMPDLQAQRQDNVIEIEMPIGAYSHYDISPTCGLLSEHEIIGSIDDSLSFLEPARIQSQLLWFKKGFIEYIFPNKLPSRTRCKSMSFSMEICSEAPMYNTDWPSDITLWINDKEIGTWTSPGDFGGERGVLTPTWWSVRNTQYGLLKDWKVNLEGSYVDGMKISEVKLKDISLEKHKSIKMRVGVKDKAKNIGGINLFGNKFGNYRQGIVLHILYDELRNGKSLAIDV